MLTSFQRFLYHLTVPNYPGYFFLSVTVRELSLETYKITLWNTVLYQYSFHLQEDHSQIPRAMKNINNCFVNYLISSTVIDI